VRISHQPWQWSLAAELLELLARLVQRLKRQSKMFDSLLPIP
jgi:hypothetical protein